MENDYISIYGTIFDIIVEYEPFYKNSVSTNGQIFILNAAITQLQKELDNLCQNQF